MANHKSAVKRARQNVKRNAANRARRSQVRTLTKAVEVAVASDATTALTALRAAESGLARAAGRGTIHKNTAARRTSRLAKRVKAATAKA